MIGTVILRVGETAVDLTGWGFVYAVVISAAVGGWKKH